MKMRTDPDNAWKTALEQRRDDQNPHTKFYDAGNEVISACGQNGANFLQRLIETGSENKHRQLALNLVVEEYERKRQAQFSRRSEIQSWTTTGIALVALVVSIIAITRN